MSKEIKNADKVIAYWMVSSERNHKTMMHLFQSGDYSWALFLGHLVIEKLLKAHYVKSLKRHAVFTHDLLRLSKEGGLELSKEQEEWMDKITTFNLNARYDNYKHDFYKLCTKEYTETWIKRIEMIRAWLIQRL